RCRRVGSRCRRGGESSRFDTVKAGSIAVYQSSSAPANASHCCSMRREFLLSPDSSEGPCLAADGLLHRTTREHPFPQGRMRSALTDRVWPGESFVGSSVGFLVQLKKFHPMNMTID